MESEPETCDGCEHLIHEERKDMELPDEAYQFWCGHDDLFTPGINTHDAGEFSNFIGFMPVVPDFCPLKFWKQQPKIGAPPMQYIIAKWIPADLKWEVVFYCKDYTQYEKQAIKYPEENGYIHMIDIKGFPGHQVYAEFAAMKAKAYADARAKVAAAKLQQSS